MNCSEQQSALREVDDAIATLVYAQKLIEDGCPIAAACFIQDARQRLDQILGCWPVVK